MRSAKKKIKISATSSMKEIAEEKDHIAEVTDWAADEDMPPLRLDDEDDQKDESMLKSGRKLRSQESVYNV